MYKTAWEQVRFETKYKFWHRFKKFANRDLTTNQVVVCILIMHMVIWWTLCIKSMLRSVTKIILEITYHFIIDLMEVNFTHFIYDVFTLKCDESETWKKRKEYYKSNSYFKGQWPHFQPSVIRNFIERTFILQNAAIFTRFVGRLFNLSNLTNSLHGAQSFLRS
jgi:hypothetical protein